MKPVSYCKIVVCELDARFRHFGALLCLMGLLAVSLAVCCQCMLCAGRSVPSAWLVAVVTGKLGLRFLPRHRSACVG